MVLYILIIFYSLFSYCCFSNYRNHIVTLSHLADTILSTAVFSNHRNNIVTLSHWTGLSLGCRFFLIEIED